MQKNFWLITLILSTLIIIFSTNVYSCACGQDSETGACLTCTAAPIDKNAETFSDSSTMPSSFDSTSWTPSGFSSPQTPPNPIDVRGAQIKDYRGLFISGNDVGFSSASYAKSPTFNFNNIANANLNINDGVLLSAQVTSSINNNILSINNPFDIAN